MESKLTAQQIQGIKDHEAQRMALINLLKEKYSKVEPIKKKKK